MFKFLQRKVSGATEKVVKFDKIVLMEGVIAIAVLTMYSDDDAEDSEREAIAKILANKPELAAFGPQVSKTFSEYDTLCKESGMIIARVKLMRKIEAVKGDKSEMEDVWCTGLAVALADGEIEESERKTLTKIGQVLGFRIEDYL